MSDSVEFDARNRQLFVLHATPLRRFVVALARLLFQPIMQLDVRGLNYLPVEGGFVLASNHITNWDVIAMQLAVPRPIFFMGKAELFRFTPVGAVLGHFGAFPVYRGEKDEWALWHARRVLDAGQVLGMFPEGHRSKGKGLGLAKTGSARLAIDAHCPLVPMAIEGTEPVLARLLNRARIKVTFMEPLHACPGETSEQLTERLMHAIADALPPDSRGDYR